MIRSELVLRVAKQNLHLSARDAEAMVGTILGCVAEALANGDRVELRDFGSFCVRHREAHTAQNPRTGKQVKVPARAYVHFRPGKGMRVRLNLDRADPKHEADRILRAS